MEPKSSDFAAASGNGYELQMGRFSRLLAPKFLDQIKFEDSRHILDAGCGTGALTSEILRRTEAANIVGIDISEAKITRHRYGPSKASAVTGLATNVPEANSSTIGVFVAPP